MWLFRTGPCCHPPRTTCSWSTLPWLRSLEMSGDVSPYLLREIVPTCPNSGQESQEGKSLLFRFLLWRLRAFQIPWCQWCGIFDIMFNAFGDVLSLACPVERLVPQSSGPWRGIFSKKHHWQQFIQIHPESHNDNQILRWWPSKLRKQQANPGTNSCHLVLYPETKPYQIAKILSSGVIF